MPISAFAHALRAFHSGDLSQDELSWEIDRQLAIEKASPVALLEVLKIQQVAQPLPNDAHDAILHHLEEWPKDPTIVTGLSRLPRVQHESSVGVGDILQGRFSLVALIGEGGMSRVFKAIDLRRMEAGASEPYIAIKVLTAPYGDYFGSIVSLQRETHKLQSLSHPNIVRVIDCDRDSKTVFMTMEYLAGESLQKKMRAAGASGIDSVTANAFLTSIASALEYAHRNHIVHGDLKPGNIIVMDNGVVKVIDFGMAKFIARPDADPVAEPSEHTPKAVTPRYASPELAAGGDPEPADDVYALACIAYELLSGQQRDPRTHPTHPTHPPRPDGMRSSQYAALTNALAFDRQRRTASVAEFMDQLFGTRRRIPRTRSISFTLGVIVAGLVVAFALWAVRHRTGTLRPGGTEVAAPGTSLRDCAACPSMVVVPPGTFQQGSAAADGLPFEKPQHTVVIAHAFVMSSNEVTVGEFREFAAATHREVSGCNVYDGRWHYDASASWQAPGFVQNATHPVACVSWDDGVAYAQWLSAKSGHSYKLPSASQWEYAARAGADQTQPWGAEASAACLFGNFADQSAAQRFRGWSVFPCTDQYVNTAPVGSFRSNSFGINDLMGNVFEWVQDCWHDDYAGAPVDGSARLDGTCQEHELRGGSWYTAPQYVSASYRNRFDTGYRSSAVGFRLVRETGQ